MRHLVSEDEWLDWKTHPVTKRVLGFLHDEREELKEQWAIEALSRESEFEDRVANAFALGLCRAYAQVINLKVEDLNEQDEQSEWSGPAGPGGAGEGLHA